MGSPTAVNFVAYERPFRHWIAEGFLPPALVEGINREWPPYDDPRWRHKDNKGTLKSALQFPAPLPRFCDRIARQCYSGRFIAGLNRRTGRELQPDPWFRDGPTEPRVGGGLSEIHPGGFLRTHVDFNQHPTGLRRALNLLIYLNEDWQPKWQGQLELHNADSTEITRIDPFGGRAVMFETNETSWHGHPHPLACPVGITRRSLALYYYDNAPLQAEPHTTIYRP